MRNPAPQSQGAPSSASSFSAQSFFVLGIGGSKHSTGWWKAVKCQRLKAEAFIKAVMLGKEIILNITAALTNPVTQSRTKKWGVW